LYCWQRNIKHWIVPSQKQTCLISN